MAALTGDLEGFAPGLTASRLAALRRHQLTPWLYHTTMQRQWATELPPPVLATLRHDYALSLRAALQQEREISGVIQALAAAGVETTVLKGAELRYRLYGDPGVRTISDLDLLVSPAALARAEGALAGLGYHLYGEHQLRAAAWQQVGSENIYVPPPPLALLVDLHWETTSVFHYYRLPYEPLRQAALALDLYGAPVFVLAPEHTLIHLCLEACEDFPRLNLLLDLAVMLREAPVDWDRFLKAAAQFHCQRPVFLMLSLLSRFLPRQVPPPVMAALAEYRPTLIELAVLHPRLRYLTLGLPSFWRHRNLQGWLVFIRSDLLPREDQMAAVYGQAGRGARLRRAWQKLSAKIFPPQSR
jgi:hypothetical protein